MKWTPHVVQRRSKATDEAHCTCCCVTGKVFVVLQDRVHECVVNHTRFGQWYVSNNQLAVFRSDIHRPSQQMQTKFWLQVSWQKYLRLCYSVRALSHIRSFPWKHARLLHLGFVTTRKSMKRLLQQRNVYLRTGAMPEIICELALECLCLPTGAYLRSGAGRLSAKWRHARSIFVSLAIWGANRASRLEQDLLCDTHSAFIL